MRVVRRTFAVLIAVFLAPALLRADETVRTLKAELTGADASHFAVENLLGTMRISVGTEPSVTVTATVYGETAELADGVRLERMGGQGGAVTLRVRYPYDKVSTFRYREPSDRGDDLGFGSWASSSDYDYDGHHVRVSRGRGKYLHADLEIRVPAGSLDASFRNLAGLVEADGLKGKIHFAVSSADLRLRGLDGAIELDGSSGDVRARDIKGSWKSDFSSGDTDLDGFQGESLSFQTSSGDLVLRSIRAKTAEFETSSGDVRLVDADLEQFTARATSGDVAFEAAGNALKQVRITTSSGDVALRLPSNAPFDVEANQSSGDMEVGFSDGTPVLHRDTMVGYHRGTGGARIQVHTSSGDLSVSPG
jgi:hypothetical protein